MKKYKVVCLAVLGLNKKIFTAGDVVFEEQFPSGNAEKLVQSGHLTRIESASAAAAVTTTTVTEKPAYNGITVDEIKAILTSRGVDFSEFKKKSDLYALL